MKIHWQFPFNQIAFDSLCNELNKSSTNFELTMGEQIVSSDIEILINGFPTNADLEFCKETLKFVVIPFSGVKPSTVDVMRNFPNIPLHNLHFNDVFVAEQCMTLMMTCARLTIQTHQMMASGKWISGYFNSLRYKVDEKWFWPPAITFTRKTVLILGFGAIGKAVAKRCLAFDMKVKATKRTVRDSDRQDASIEVFDGSKETLHQLLPSADFIVVCVPMTNDTTDLIDATEFQLMKNTCIVVNVARGPVINETALFNALKQRRIHSAGIDVWYNYPKIEDNPTPVSMGTHPFEQLDNIVMAPHTASYVEKAAQEAERSRHLAALLNALVDDPLHAPNKVQMEQGY